MRPVIEIDFETRGYHDIGGSEGVGLYNYFNDPRTEILMMGYRLPGATKSQLWEPHLGQMPNAAAEAIDDPGVDIMAFNSPFERNALRFKLGRDLPPERFIDPQVGGRYLALPADLESVGTILGLPPWLQKDKRGDQLIKLFCEPVVERQTKKNPNPRTYFNDWNSHPAEWQAFGEYCMRDIDAESEVYRREEMLGAMPMSPFERELWCFDQRVNDRGMPVDIAFVRKAYGLALRAKQEALDSQNALTGLENSNSVTQLLPWVRERGYPYNTLNKAFVEAALNDPQYTLTDICRIVLKARLSAGSTSYTKMSAVMRNVCPDGVIRNMFIYLGSSRCGRWAGSAVQPHNFPRPSKPKDVNGHDFEELETVMEARAMIYAEDYNGIIAKYGNVLEVIKSTLRTIFVAPGNEGR